MKRNCLLLSMTLAATFLSASVGFVVPDKDNPYESSWTYEKFPYEGYNDGSEHGECPERTAFIWYSSNNCTSSDKRFFSMYDIEQGALLTDGKPTVTALWFNLDRSGTFDQVIRDLLNRTDFKNAIAAYIKAGGNVLLTKQAARLVLEMGRCDLWTTVEFYGVAYSNTSTADYQIVENVDDETEYKLFSGCTFTDSKYSLSSNSGSANRECVWNFFDTYGEPHDVPANRTKFEEDYKCKILAFDGNETNRGGMIEFYPKDDFKGTILVIGTNAYDWGEQNTLLSNVKKLTQNALDYLSQRVTASWTTSPKTNPIIKEEEDVAITMSEHCSLSFTSSDVTKAEISAEGHISYNHFGNVTITAVVTGDGKNIPKNKVELSEIRTVTGGTIAPYAYALPFSFYTMNNYDGGDGTWKPDYQAAKWFYDNYVVTGKGCFINPINYSSSTPIPTTIKVLWVNNDRVGQESDALKTAFGGNDFANALSAFVVSGGNVFLSKQATRFIGDIGRAKWWPSYGVSSEGPADGPWYMVDNFVAVNKGEGARKVNFHDHPVYATLRATKANQYTKHIWTEEDEDKSIIEHDEGYCKWPLFDGEGNRTKMTYIWGEPTSVWSGTYDMSSGNRTTEYVTLTNFENNAGMKCKILGGWGHTTALDAVGFAEFPPATIDDKTFGGSVICIGLPAYQWSVGNTYIGNVRALTQGILDYLGGVVVVTEPDTEIPSTVNDLVVYQGGSVSNTEGITVTNSITYIRPAVGGAASNELGHWYTFCLPFTPSHCYVYEEGDKDYEINSVYLSGAKGETESNPLGPGSFYLQTFAPPAGWAYIGGEGKPLIDTPYIIKFLNATEDDGKGRDLAEYFTANPTIMFVGGPQDISGTDEGKGGTPNGDYSYHVNHTLRKLTMSHVYPLNTATNMFEYDYGGPSEIMPFECYIKASTPALAAARPQIAIGRRAQQGTEITTAVETVAAPAQPLCIYDVTGRLFYIGDEPRQLPQGIWIVRQGKDSRTIVIP